jgi:hypothetical protein
MIKDDTTMIDWLRHNQLRLHTNFITRKKDRVAYYTALETPTSATSKRKVAIAKDSVKSGTDYKEPVKEKDNYEVKGKIKFRGARGKGKIRFFSHLGNESDKKVCGLSFDNTAVYVVGNMSYRHTK